MSHLLRLFVLLSTGLAINCTTAKGGGCGNQGDCAPGYVCQGTCQKLCSSDAECGSGQVCGATGICMSQDAVLSPLIEDITGEDGTTQLRSRIRIVGKRLSDAWFQLTPETNQEPLANLDPHVVSDNEVLLQLPADIRSGAYTLAAVNESGTSTAEITLTLPELDGDEILNRLNVASGHIDVQRLPLDELDLRYHQIGDGTLAVENTFTVGPGLVAASRSESEEHTDVTVNGNATVSNGNLTVEGSTQLAGPVASNHVWSKLGINYFDDHVQKSISVPDHDFSSLRVVFNGTIDCNNNPNQRVLVRFNNENASYWSTADSFNHGGRWGPHSEGTGLLTGVHTCYDENPASITFEYTIPLGNNSVRVAYGSGTFLDPAHIRHWQLSGGRWFTPTITSIQITTQGAARLTGRMELWGVRDDL